MTVRVATADDRSTLHRLLGALEREEPRPPWTRVDDAELLGLIDEYVQDHLALLAEDDGAPVGFLLGRLRKAGIGYVSDLYVEPEARRHGIAAALVREAVARFRDGGAEVVELEVRAANADARVVYERWGFRETLVRLAAQTGELEQRLGRTGPEPSVGWVYAQTDDLSVAERAVTQFVPRLGHSEQTVVHPPRNGWICVEDELCSREPSLLRRLAQELSYRTGGVVLALGIEEGAVVRYVLFERGSVADEYASLPEHFGALPPGDVVALAANPRVVARLTGADPGRVRAVARTASSPAELPAPDELLAQLAEVLGVGSVS
jgi:GNAT superfamily N-acetyltransferase